MNGIKAAPGTKQVRMKRQSERQGIICAEIKRLAPPYKVIKVMMAALPRNDLRWHKR